MATILVTGATGFIGGHLVRTLVSQHHRVRCLVRQRSSTTALASLDVELAVADLDNPQELDRWVQDCDLVFHLAGRTSALKREDLFRTNALGSQAIAEACAKKLTPPTLIVVSSLAAAGTGVAGRPRDISDRIRPVSEYGRSKRAGELAAIAWAHRIPLSIVRPGIVFGPANREMLPMFLSVARYHVHAVPGFTARRVALIHDDDLIEILLRVAERGKRIAPGQSRTSTPPAQRISSDGFYFVADPQFPTYAQLGRMLNVATGRSGALVLPIAEPIAWLAAAGNQWVNRLRGQTDSFNIDKMREAFAGHWTLQVSRLHSELGFVPPLSLQERLNATANWYRQHGWI